MTDRQTDIRTQRSDQGHLGPIKITESIEQKKTIVEEKQAKDISIFIHGWLLCTFIILPLTECSLQVKDVDVRQGFDVWITNLKQTTLVFGINIFRFGLWEIHGTYKNAIFWTNVSFSQKIRSLLDTLRKPLTFYIWVDGKEENNGDDSVENAKYPRTTLIRVKLGT